MEHIEQESRTGKHESWKTAVTVGLLAVVAAGGTYVGYEAHQALNTQPSVEQLHDQIMDGPHN